MVWLLGRARDFSHLQSLQTSSCIHPISYWMDNGGSFLYSGWGVKLTTDPYLMLRLRTQWSYVPLPHVPSWHKLGQLFLFPDFTFTLLYFMDINGQHLSRMMASTNCEKMKMVWKQGDRSCFAFLKYNDGHDSTFHKTLHSQAFTDKL